MEDYKKVYQDLSQENQNKVLSKARVFDLETKGLISDLMRCQNVYLTWRRN